MSCIARTFGAPLTVPAGKQARRTSNGVVPGRSSPDDLGDEVRDVREALDLHVPRDVHGAGGADAREIVAPEVDEHDVLGAVLLGREEPLDVALGRLGRPGDRAQACAAVLAGDEPLGRRADEGDAVEVEEEEVRRRVHAAERAVDVERRRGRRTLGALRRHGLEDVPGDDVLLHRADHLLVAGALREAPKGPGLAARLAVPRHARVEPARDLLLVPGEDLGRAGAVVEADERLGDDRAATPGTRARRTGGARSARGARRGRRRGSRRRAGRAPPPPRSRPVVTRLPSTSSARVGRARPTRGGSSRVPSRAGGGTRRAASGGRW